MDSLWHDLRYGFRLLLRTPLISMAAILSLALGTGANTAIFSLMDAVVFRDLSVHDPQDLLVLKWSAKTVPGGGVASYGTNTRENGRTVNWSFNAPIFEALHKPTAVVSGVAGFNGTGRVSLTTRGQATVAEGVFVSGEFFEVTGVSPYAGRLLAPADDQPGAPLTVVVSHRLWKEHLAGQLSAIGETVLINGNQYAVVGITPPEFNGISSDARPDFYVPVAAEPQIMPRLNGRDPDLWWIQLVARKRPGVSREQAQAALNGVFQQNLPWHNLSPAETPSLQADPGSRGYEFLRQRYQEPLWVLMALVVMLLLIACTNVANLLLARGVARRGENAVRVAMGAGRARLLRQHLTEALMVAILGGAGGIVLARWGRDAILALIPNFSQLGLDARLDWRVFSFTLVVALCTGILFGLAPAWQASRIDPAPVLQSEARLTTGGWRRLDAGRLLVLGQIALSLMLVIAAGLFLRNLRHLQSVRLGFNPENLLLFRVSGLQAGYKSDDLVRFYGDMLARVSSLPGVRSATYSSFPLIGGGSWSSSGVKVAGQPVFERDGRNTKFMPAEPGYFRTMEIPLLLGRLIDARDQANSPKVAVVNERFVRMYLPNTSPLGRQLRFSQKSSETIEIVGVVRNTRYNSLRDEEPAIAYLPYAQQPSMFAVGAIFALRTDVAPESIVPSLRQAVRTLDPNLPLSNVETQTAHINNYLAQERLFAFLSLAFGGLAVLLAAIGLYGLMAYAVSRRTPEIGVRLALGATQANIGWLILRDVTALVAAGIAAGVAGAVGVSTLVEKSLYQVAPTDPATIAVGAAIMAGVALAAACLPARRAAKLDPMIALRHE